MGGAAFTGHHLCLEAIGDSELGTSSLYYPLMILLHFRGGNRAIAKAIHLRTGWRVGVKQSCWGRAAPSVMPTSLWHLLPCGPRSCQTGFLPSHGGSFQGLPGLGLVKAPGVQGPKGCWCPSLLSEKAGPAQPLCGHWECQEPATDSAVHLSPCTVPVHSVSSRGKGVGLS